MSNRRKAVFEALRSATPSWLRRAVPRSAKRWLRSVVRSLPGDGGPGATEDDLFFCYRLLLGRAPDSNGWNTHVANVNAGMSRASLVSAFLSTPEFRNRGLHPEDRAPDLVDLGSFKIYVDPGDWAVSQPILSDRSYEPHVTAAIRSALRQGMTFVDVGANIGYFSLLAAVCVGPRGKVVAFEPSTRNCALHQLSANANGFGQIEIQPFAVAESSRLMIYDPQASNGIVSDFEGDPKVLASRQVVRAVTLDDALRSADRIDAIKLDIEGAEWRALKGGQAVLARHRPVLFTEFMPRGLGSVSKVSGAQYLQLLIDSGYTLTVLAKQSTPVECGTDVEQVLRALEQEALNHLDLMARPRSDHSRS